MENIKCPVCDELLFIVLDAKIGFGDSDKDGSCPTPSGKVYECKKCNKIFDDVDIFKGIIK